jgi:hypothetical protein
MNKIALRVGVFHHWNHLYYQGVSYLDPRFPLPLWNHFKQDQYLLRLLKGFYPQKKIGRAGLTSRSPLSSTFSGGATGRLPFQIHKTREGLELYISKDRPIYNPFPYSPYLPSTSPSLKFSNYRILFNILKTRIQIYNLFTFPLHDAELLVTYLLRDHKNKARLKAFKKLWKAGIIKGIKIKIQGRYKKSTRTQNEVYQFGQIPNTPTTNLNINLFYTRQLLLQSLGSSSLHLYIVYSNPTP